MADALCLAIMTTLMEREIEQQPRPCCTKRQAAALLKELREQYRQLAHGVRGTIKAFLLTKSNQQFSLEGEE
jgi:hypothetical protein